MKAFLFTQYINITALMLTGCANILATEGEVIVPEVHLSTPSWPKSLGFWLEVEKEFLVWKKEEENIEAIPIADWERSSIDISTGGTLSYEGRGRTGTLLVYGKTEIKAWLQENQIPKIIVLELHRVNFE